MADCQRKPAEILRELGIRPDRPHTIPGVCGDATGGSETELPAVAVGKRLAVDLPLTIENSNDCANSICHMQSGDVPRRAMNRIGTWLRRDGTSARDHIRVRLPMDGLSKHASLVLEQDLRADRADSQSGLREDADDFCCGW